MGLLTYVNYFAMVVGYITIAIVLLLIFLFIGLILKEKYENCKFKKEHERKKAQQKENVADEIQQKGMNIEVSVK